MARRKGKRIAKTEQRMPCKANGEVIQPATTASSVSSIIKGNRCLPPTGVKGSASAASMIRQNSASSSLGTLLLGALVVDRLAVGKCGMHPFSGVRQKADDESEAAAAASSDAFDGAAECLRLIACCDARRRRRGDFEHESRAG